MRALTVRQPYAAAIAYLGKDIENRDWKLPAGMLGQRVAIHASKALVFNDELQDAWGFVADQLTPEIWAAAAPWFPTGKFQDLKAGCGCILAFATLSACVEASESPWFVGTHGFVLTDIRPLAKPVGPIKGALGFWTIAGEFGQQLESLDALMSEAAALRLKNARLIALCSQFEDSDEKDAR